ncbi:LysR family transcriptional regulator [Rouxiella chamberiensis]|uniref:LysR substrate-binding domain-containing protein n=1 Tax=Rouxiella chamberiensis TaxID=1513468 RepID=A0ABY7HT41_9GAMM|nr:LysR substrate-binding domain-containing protein [Rouxiella chamberiensis]WAT02350.1 LysR substrate-binding domain-containing protein [Rouxiella chamberiensis]
MNYRQVQVFKAIMQSGSITDASEILHVSQPAVSKTLKTLEQDLGLLLFTRTAKGLLPTDEARSLYTEVERVALGFENLKRFGKTLQQIKQGRLVIGVVHTFGREWMACAIADFSARYQQISLSLITASSNDMARLVGNGQIDVGIAQSRTEDHSLLRDKLFEMEGLIAVPKGHRLAKYHRVLPEDLRDENIISLGPADGLRQNFDRAMAQAGIEYRSTIDISLGEALCVMVQQGCGIGIVDDETARLYTPDGVKFIPFHPSVSVPIYLIRARNQPHNRLIELFIDFMLTTRRR